jgi:hypothetical protein
MKIGEAEDRGLQGVDVGGTVTCLVLSTNCKIRSLIFVSEDIPGAGCAEARRVPVRDARCATYNENNLATQMSIARDIIDRASRPPDHAPLLPPCPS